MFNKNDHSEVPFLSRSAPFMDDIVVSNESVTKLLKGLIPSKAGERGGSVVECRTPEREVRGSRPTAAVLCP